MNLSDLKNVIEVLRGIIIVLTALVKLYAWMKKAMMARSHN